MSIPPTLLLADDSLTIQRVVSLTFADQPIRVVVAKDGQDAINQMSKDRPDLVLADTNMPCVDGYELARWVRRQPHLSTVPVLLLAGVTDPVDEQRLHDSGANGVLEKPFEPSHVISRVKELLGLKGAPPVAAARLVTTPDIKAAPAPSAPPSARPSSLSRPAAGAPDDRRETAGPAAPPGDSRAASLSDSPALSGPVVPPEQVARFRSEAAELAAEMGELGGAHGDAHDWFGGEAPATSVSASSLAEELGVADLRFYGQGSEVPRAGGLDVDFSPDRPRRMAASAGRLAETGDSAASTADVFQSLLAAEQGDPTRPVVIRAAAPELTPEILDQLAARMVERLRPDAIRDELQRGLGMSLRESVALSVRESVASETRAAVAEAVQAAVNGTILGTVRGAVNEAVAAAVPAAVAHELGATLARELRESVAPLVQQAVREAVDAALRQAVTDAVAAAVPAAVLDAVRGDAGGQVREVVHDTAERLVREEIARIRERRA